MIKTAAALALAAVLAAGAAEAQTANSAPTSGSSVGGGNVSRTPPSVGATGAAGSGQAAAAPTPLDRAQEHRAQKTTSSVCKGC